MSRTLTIRVTDDLADWLKRTSRRTGISAGRIVREQLERAMTESERDDRPFMKMAGIFAGPGDLSTRKGFSKK
jgi:hypothetical protein